MRRGPGGGGNLSRKYTPPSDTLPIFSPPAAVSLSLSLPPRSSLLSLEQIYALGSQ